MGKYYEIIKKNEEVRELIEGSGRCLEAMNYTEHGLRHAGYVSYTSAKLLRGLGYSEHIQDLALCAGLLHDIGNLVNRHNHGIHSAILSYHILKSIGMEYKDICTVVSAIGNHEEEIGVPVNEVSAALIIADKSDAHRTRVSLETYDPDDIHDRVNFSIKKNIVIIDAKHRIISSKFYMNSSSSVMEYFKIYLARMDMSEQAARFLDCTFRLYINEVLINSPKPISKIAIEKIKEDRGDAILATKLDNVVED